MAQKVELACKDIVFHFNKGHLTDPSIPMWVLKTKGESYYVDHVECSIPWSTKETPDNSHTKGAIKVKNCHLVIDDDNTAIIKELTVMNSLRLNGKKNPIRLITSKGTQLRQALKNHKINHGALKLFGGGCGTSWYVVSIADEKDFLFLSLTVDGLRKLMPNEDYYIDYEKDNRGYLLETEEDFEEELYDN